MRLTAALAGLLAAAAPAAHAAQVKSAAQDKYAITDRERAACTADAMRLCLSTYPNADRLLSCMKQNRAALTPTCLVVFDAGVRRRHL